MYQRSNLRSHEWVWRGAIAFLRDEERDRMNGDEKCVRVGVACAIAHSVP
ncbi:hypothetical protein [Argonema galeatum]|nr:hypothetical protein [Argonema galeatum]MCL1464341.1 hypothetical protein [Argonema galeatum A003/A1]